MRLCSLLYMWILIHHTFWVFAVRSPIGRLPGVSIPREVRIGRCTELDPSAIERFEKQFALDTAKRGIELVSSEKVHSYSNASQPTVNKRLPIETIKIFFHIISADRTSANGNVLDTQILQQVAVLNMGFELVGIEFVLAGIDRTINPDWFNNGGPATDQQNDMKASLRRGGVADLNIYTVNFQGTWAGLLGYSTFPQSYALNPNDDGVVVLFSSLPGGSTTSYNEGKTAVHETGHWAGLYHTFQGSCFDPGDYVADTMPEAIPSEGCPEGRISCIFGDVLLDESDPIHNYMDYSTDSCMSGFTPGQTERARTQLRFYRGINIY